MNEKKLSIEYIAGLVDGDGSIRIGLNNKKGRNMWESSISVDNTHRGVLERLMEELGGTIVTMKKRITIERGLRADYRWRLNGKKAVPLLKQLLPHLIVKKEQVELLIEFTTTLAQGIKTPIDVHEYRVELMDQCKGLNMKKIKNGVL